MDQIIVKFVYISAKNVFMTLHLGNLLQWSMKTSADTLDHYSIISDNHLTSSYVKGYGIMDLLYQDHMFISLIGISPPSLPIPAWSLNKDYHYLLCPLF